METTSRLIVESSICASLSVECNKSVQTRFVEAALHLFHNKNKGAIPFVFVILHLGYSTMNSRSNTPPELSAAEQIDHRVGEFHCSSFRPKDSEAGTGMGAPKMVHPHLPATATPTAFPSTLIKNSSV